MTCGEFNGDYTVFGNKDLTIMKDYNWKILAINLLQNIVSKRYTENIYNREEIKAKSGI